MFALAPDTIPAASPTDRPRVFPAEGERRMRVALLLGCAQRVLAPEINEATIRLLTRHGCEVVVAQDSALVHHLGQERGALGFARANIDAWERERLASGLDAIVINASGCGTTVKDYGFMLRTDPQYAQKAAKVIVPCRPYSPTRSEVMRKPDRTKKVSTPRNPPRAHPASRWYAKTERTAKARRPSSAGWYAKRRFSLTTPPGVRNAAAAGDPQ